MSLVGSLVSEPACCSQLHGTKCGLRNSQHSDSASKPADLDPSWLALHIAWVLFFLPARMRYWRAELSKMPRATQGRRNDTNPTGNKVPLPRRLTTKLQRRNRRCQTDYSFPRSEIITTPRAAYSPRRQQFHSGFDDRLSRSGIR